MADGEHRERGFARWWRANRGRAQLLAIAAVAIGGIVCMVLTVLALIATRG